MGPGGHSLAALAALGSLPVGLGALVLRPRLRVGLPERLGWGLAPGAAAGGIWVHAASVGEALAALALVDRLRAGGRRVCMSTLTVTGREVVRGRRPDLPCALAPLDHPWCVAAALDRARPAALVLVETELWPAWIRSARERGVRVVSISARLSERSLRRWLRVPWLSGPTARRLAAVGARTPEDAARFAALGVPEARIRVTGDLKLEPPAAPPPPPPELAAALGDAPLLVAASTHVGEEEAALAALGAAEGEATGDRRPVLLIAPRHPERFGEVARAVRAAGRTLHRRSALGTRPVGGGDVLLLDSLGELGSLFARALCTFVGGSLVDRGGHNVLEPAVAGCPVVVGSHTANVEHAVRLLEAAGAAERIEDAAGLARAFRAALSDPEAARSRGGRGRAAVEAQRGVAERSASLVEEVLACAAPLASRASSAPPSSARGRESTP